MKSRTYVQEVSNLRGSAPKEWLLTYVNELLAAPDKAGIIDVPAHVDDSLNMAKQWLRQEELPELRFILKELLNYYP